MMRAYNLRSALQKPEFITGLFLNRMELTAVPPEVFQLPNLKELDLSFNAVEELPAAIGQLAQLERLTLSHNRIRRLPFELGQLPLLREIRLENNRLAAWPEVLHRLPNLKELDLSRNELENIPKSSEPFLHLRELSLARNNFKKIPKRIGQWRALRSLDLSHNRLGRAPAALGDCLELDHLDLGHNRLRQLPPDFSKMQNLRILSVEANLLTDIPEVVFSLRHLRSLAAAGNRIRRLPEAVARLQWLSRLDLSRNELDEAPASLTNCLQLQELLLGENALSALPPLAALSRLRRLDIRKNQLKDLPAAPSGLKILTASRNLLTVYPSVLCDLPDLEDLDLSHNPLTVLPENFHRLQKLEKLDLRKTGIGEWPPPLFHLNRLKDLKVDWPVSQRKVFFRLLTACLKADTAPEDRRLFFRLLIEEGGPAGELSLRVLFRAAGLKYPELRRVARAELFRRRGSASAGLDADSRLCILGKTALPPGELIPRLSCQDVPVSETPDKLTTHILLAEFPDWSPVLEQSQSVYLTEPQLVKWLDEREGRYLRTPAGRAETARLGELLLHDDPANVQLAVQIMRGGGVPEDLLTDLLIAWKKAAPGALRRQLRQMLWQYTPEHARWVLEIPLSLSSRQPEALLRANIARICANTPFEEEKIISGIYTSLNRQDDAFSP